MNPTNIAFGNKEWFEALNKTARFPSIFAFYYDKQKDMIQISRVNSRAKVENVRYQDIKPLKNPSHSVDTALICVKYIQTDKEYYDELVHLKKIWKTKHPS